MGSGYSFPYSFFVLLCFFSGLFWFSFQSGFWFFSWDWAYIVITYFFVLLPAGATACVELKRFEEAITWCYKGLLVSSEAIFYFLTMGIMKIFHDISTEKMQRQELVSSYFKWVWLNNVGKVKNSWLDSDILLLAMNES